MVVKVKESFEKTRQVKNNDKSRKYILRGYRKARYHEKTLSKKKKSNNFINFLQDLNRYRVEIFSVKTTFDDLSNDVSHFVLAQNFIISTCLRYVDIYRFCQFSRRWQ